MHLAFTGNLGGTHERQKRCWTAQRQVCIHN